MTHQSTTVNFKRKMQRVFLMLAGLLFMLPNIGISSPQPPPGAPGPLGGSPDPLGVPFDWRLNMLLIAAGIIFAIVILKKVQKRNLTANNI